MSNAERAMGAPIGIDYKQIERRAGKLTAPWSVPTPLEDAAVAASFTRSRETQIEERQAFHVRNIDRGRAFAKAYLNRNEDQYPGNNEPVKRSLFGRTRVKVAAGVLAASGVIATATGAAANEATGQTGISAAQAPPDLGELPFGYLDSAQKEPDGFLHLRGWTVDPSGKDPALGLTPNAVDVWEVDTNTYLGRQYSWDARPDVDEAYPGVGDHHGFHTAIKPSGPGAHQISVYNLNFDERGNKVEAGGHQLLGTTYVWDEPNQLGLLLLDQRFADQDLSKVRGVIDCEAGSNVHSDNGQYTSYFQVDMELHRGLFDSPEEGISMEQVREGVRNFDGSPHAINMLERYLDVSYGLWTGTDRQRTWPTCGPQVGA